jgi:hypothetical protein
MNLIIIFLPQRKSKKKIKRGERNISLLLKRKKEKMDLVSCGWTTRGSTRLLLMKEKLKTHTEGA